MPRFSQSVSEARSFVVHCIYHTISSFALFPIFVVAAFCSSFVYSIDFRFNASYVICKWYERVLYMHWTEYSYCACACVCVPFAFSNIIFKPLSDVWSISSGNTFISIAIIHKRKCWWISWTGLLCSKWPSPLTSWTLEFVSHCNINHWPVSIDSSKRKSAIYCM